MSVTNQEHKAVQPQTHCYRIYQELFTRVISHELPSLNYTPLLVSYSLVQGVWISVVILSM